MKDNTIQARFWNKLDREEKMYILHHIYHNQVVINKYIKVKYNKLSDIVKTNLIKYIEENLKSGTRK